MRDFGSISRANPVRICRKIPRGILEGITGMFYGGILGGTLGERDNASK